MPKCKVRWCLNAPHPGCEGRCRTCYSARQLALAEARQVIQLERDGRAQGSSRRYGAVLVVVSTVNPRRVLG